MCKPPEHIKTPAYLTKSPPVPTPEAGKKAETDPLGNDPTRYGDWERKGIAVDF
jgi:hypothetical protein